MTHYEYMQEQGQLTIDDILLVHESDHKVSTVYDVGDTVRIDLSQADDMAANYFRYYYPHIVNKSGYIVDSRQLANGYLYLVNVLGELHWFNEYELV